MKPVKTDLPPASDYLLYVIRCNCRASFKNTCGSKLFTCRKNALKCMPACGDCRGVACENMIEEEIITSMSDGEDDVVEVVRILKHKQQRRLFCKVD